MTDILTDLLGQPNIVEAQAGAGLSGTTVSLAAPLTIRKRSGQFRLSACGNIGWSSLGGSLSATLQFQGSNGAVGPSIVIGGSTAGGSSHFAMSWVDITGLAVGQPISYSIQAQSGGGAITLPQGQAAIVVDEG